MSGYLQRLVTQAVESQGNVRPLANPFTGPATIAATPEPTDEGPLEETVYTSVDQPKRISKKMETPSEMSGQESVKGLSQDAGNRVVRESEERSQFQPLLSGTNEVLANVVDHLVNIIPVHQESSREEFPLDNAHDDGSQAIVVKEGAHARTGKDLTRSSIVRRQPPLSEGPAREVHPQEVRILSPTAARRPDPHLLWNSTSASHGADEIQINIGRIEVTAMPQSTPRPAPPARKSINLDEYLRRRNGRNG